MHHFVYKIGPPFLGCWVKIIRRKIKKSWIRTIHFWDYKKKFSPKWLVKKSEFFWRNNHPDRNYSVIFFICSKTNPATTHRTTKFFTRNYLNDDIKLATINKFKPFRSFLFSCCFLSKRLTTNKVTYFFQPIRKKHVYLLSSQLEEYSIWCLRSILNENQPHAHKSLLDF